MASDVPFLLNIDYSFPGGNRLEYDAGVTDRVQVLVPAVSLHQTLDIMPDDLIGLSLTDVRGPARTRHKGR